MLHHKVKSLISNDKSFKIRYKWVDLKDMTPFMPLAVIVAEDQNFQTHFGFDFKALLKAVKNNIRHPRRIRGGSTITQQTAKNLFLWPARSYVRKAFEAYFTILLEIFWPKKRIIEVYLNVAEFGKGVYGVGEASRIFFNKPPKKLTPVEASYLVAVLPNPKKYDAKDPSGFVYERSEWIEEQMNFMGGTSAIRDIIK